MTTIFSILSAIALASLFCGCSSSASVSAGHNGHEHGVAAQGRADRTGVGVGTRAQ
jgi:hypothetical protein